MEVDAEDRWFMEAGSEYVFIDGVMDHGASAGLRNEENERWAARLEVEYRVSERWSLNVGFMELRDLNVSGNAACSAPWLEPGEGCRMALTPMRFESDLQQYDFGLDYTLWSNDRNALSVGGSGVLSVVRNSRFEFVDRIFAGNDPTHRLNDRFVHDETQWDLGTRMGYRYDIAKNWSLTAGYRLTQPPGRTLHHAGLGLGALF